MSEKVYEVSIVMSGYKTNTVYFRKALDSISKQTYRDFELIFVDDGCGKEALEILEEYKVFFPIRIITNNENIGLPKSLNKGISLSNSKYIARFDDDDVMYEDRLQRQVEFMERHPEYVGCWSEFATIDQNDKVLSYSKIGTNNLLKKFIGKGNCCCHSTFFVKRDIIVETGGYNEKYLYAQDVELYVRILMNYDMRCVSECLVNFRIDKERSVPDKRILSRLFSYSVSVRYWHQKRTIKALGMMIKRTLILLKYMFLE